MLSVNAVKRLIHAVTSRTAGNEIATAIDAAGQLVTTLLATSVSTTTDFASLKVGDRLVHIPATAGNAQVEVIATAGTKPSAAVVGDLYMVLRAAPAARNEKL